MTSRMDRRTLLLAGLGSFAAACTTTTSGVESGELWRTPDDQADPIEPAGADAGPTDMVMIGDSITVMSTPALHAALAATGLTVDAIDAQVGRRMNVGNRAGLMAGSEVVRFIAGSADPPDVWVVALGANDVGQYPDEAAYAEQVDLFLAAIPSGAPLVWIDAWHRDRRDETELFNGVVRSALDRRDGRSVVGDWFGHGDDEGVITRDGVHPTERGMEVFAEVTASAVQELLDGL